MLPRSTLRRVRTLGRGVFGVPLRGWPYTEAVAVTEAEIVLLRFGAFELDLRNSELRRGGVLVKLSPQQFQLLKLLAGSGGQLLTRDEIQREIWGPDTHVDFDRNLNVCMTQIRSALNDDSEAPRFIQTVPRRGYRFIAPVEKRAASPIVPESANPESANAPARGLRGKYVVSAIALVAIVAATLSWRYATRDTRLMIAVLPVRNLTQDAADDPVAGGITEELISQLGEIQPARLGVIGRSSVDRYRNAAPGLDQVGRDLGVAYVVEGALRDSGGRVRITARLVKVAGQAQAWTETWEEDRANVFEMQEKAAVRVASAVASRLLPGAPPTHAKLHTPNRDAYDAYLKGRYLAYTDSKRSVGYLADATQLDPAFADAFAALASALVARGRSGALPAETFPRAKTAALAAIALNETNAEAHNALANELFWYDWNRSEAERHFQRAIAINPSFAAAHHDYAFLLVASGRTEEGVASLRRAIALDPLSAQVNIDAGWLLLQAHRFDEAIRQARRALELEPGMPEAQACIARALRYQGKADAHSTAVYRALVEDRSRLASMDPFSVAQAYAFLGDRGKAMDNLERAHAAHSIMMPLLNTEPAFSDLLNDPRFQELARKLQ
jgi:TolB-like protein/DNA-binding winged helix-turn-helix (wHTH) protein